MSKVESTRNSQALNLGIQSTISDVVPQVVGHLSSSDSTSATTDYNCSDADDLAGLTIVTIVDSATPVYSYGIIQGNTATATSDVAVDGWFSLLDNSPTTPPDPSTLYIVLPSQMPFVYVGLSDSTSAVAGTETGDSIGGTEYTSEGLERQAVTTFTHTAGAATASLSVTFTYTGSTSQVVGRSFLSNSPVMSANFVLFVDQLNSGTGYTVASNGDTLSLLYTTTLTTVP